MLNLSVDAEGSRGIIVAVQVGSVKIYVAAVEALTKEERQGETQEMVVSYPQITQRNFLVHLECTFSSGMSAAYFFVFHFLCDYRQVS
jgi:hypothetical protein